MINTTCVTSAAAIFIVISSISSWAATPEEQFQAMKSFNQKFSSCAAVASIENTYNPSVKQEQYFMGFRKMALLMGERTAINSSETEKNIQEAALAMNQIRLLSPKRFENAQAYCENLLDAFAPK